MKNFKPNFLIIPLITIFVALAGSYFTSLGMPWYQSLQRPSLTPPGWAFSVAWTTIFICAAISAIIFWNVGKDQNKILWIFPNRTNIENYKLITVLFVVNAALNVLWTLMFFYLHQALPALLEIVALEGTVITLMILIWRISKVASILLLPYALWLILAFYLNYAFYILNFA